MLKEIHNNVAALKVSLQFDKVPQNAEQIRQIQYSINQYKKQISELEKLLMSESDYSHNSSDLQEINIIKAEIQAIENLLIEFHKTIEEDHNSNTVDLIPADDQVEGLEEEEESDEGTCKMCRGKCYLIFQISLFFLLVIVIVTLSLVFADKPSVPSNDQNENASTTTETYSSTDFTQQDQNDPNKDLKLLMMSEIKDINDP